MKVMVRENGFEQTEWKEIVIKQLLVKEMEDREVLFQMYGGKGLGLEELFANSLFIIYLSTSSTRISSCSSENLEPMMNQIHLPIQAIVCNCDYIHPE